MCFLGRCWQRLSCSYWLQASFAHTLRQRMSLALTSCGTSKLPRSVGRWNTIKQQTMFPPGMTYASTTGTRWPRRSALTGARISWGGPMNRCGVRSTDVLRGDPSGAIADQTSPLQPFPLQAREMSWKQVLISESARAWLPWQRSKVGGVPHAGAGDAGALLAGAPLRVC